jgi:hypothetical protein
MVDDQCIGDTFFQINRDTLHPLRIAATTTQVERVLADPLPGSQVWLWADGLGMTPLVLGRFAAARVRVEDLVFMDRRYWNAVDLLHVRARRQLHREQAGRKSRAPGLSRRLIGTPTLVARSSWPVA